MSSTQKQVVMITGASTGFGRLIAETLARKGHTVYATMRDVAGRNKTNVAEINALARRESLGLHTLELDVTSEASVVQAAGKVVEEAGRIDVAVNNAGFAMLGLTEAVTIEQAQKIMDTNFFGPVRVNRAVLPHMRKQGSGLLMHVSSGAGRIVIPGAGHYCSTKFALEALAESYHYELASQGIDSVIVEPGAYTTPIFGSMIKAADETRTATYGVTKDLPAKLDHILQSSGGDPQEVADVVLRIVETPAGQRQLRYRVSVADIGVDEINTVCAAQQARLLATFNLEKETTFVQRPAAATGSA